MSSLLALKVETVCVHALNLLLLRAQLIDRVCVHILNSELPLAPLPGLQRCGRAPLPTSAAALQQVRGCGELEWEGMAAGLLFRQQWRHTAATLLAFAIPLWSQPAARPEPTHSSAATRSGRLACLWQTL